ncbi:MAG: ATP-dependent metallopeptidase FtsH/Yme1/Tma family protein, partial [Flavobacteriaceae bacterium]|nr:ATP-dependent metallopeptidase FtsH/Yme1/Tma family protein [Flavobacteriaceae bacterium]
MSNNSNQNNSNQNNKNVGKPKFSSYWIYIPIALFLLYFAFGANSDKRNEISNTEFREILLTNDIKEIIIINRSVANVFLKEEAESKDQYQKYVNKSKNLPFVGKIPNFSVQIGDYQNFETYLIESREKHNLDFKRDNDEESNPFGDILLSFLPIIILIAVWIYFMRRMSGGSSGGPGGQIFNIGKSKAKLFDQNTESKITFKDVAGLEGAKEEVQEIVDFLKTPDKYTSLGGKIPKGALLVGPPGTGKTLLAKAVAGEAKVPFFSLSGSDFVEMFVGVGASRVRDLFKQAKEKSPAIIFIDEIDAIGRARGKNNFSGSNDERENTLNQLLTEMDGFGSQDNVIIIAATNRADILDKALMRAGRFDRQIHVELPNLTERREVFEVHLKPLKIKDGLNIDFLAKQTPGFSGADIANMCNEAALVAARKGKKEVERQDFLDAVDRIVGGLEKKSKIFTAEEKKTIYEIAQGYGYKPRQSSPSTVTLDVFQTLPAQDQSNVNTQLREP